MFDVDGFGLSTDGFEHASEAKVFGGAEVAMTNFVVNGRIVIGSDFQIVVG